ncbi:hypothetical protein L484_027446 [Morus notabilis]|uniref:Uncharacterized protein n=1 Tax=Morus notabilis TaxID=981085 RepID=W9SMC9_9ROSA|nr:hypothetical protein L484_027446 [Morus notabilis]
MQNYKLDPSPFMLVPYSCIYRIWHNRSLVQSIKPLVESVSQQQQNFSPLRGQVSKQQADSMKGGRHRIWSGLAELRGGWEQFLKVVGWVELWDSIESGYWRWMARLLVEKLGDNFELVVPEDERGGEGLVTGVRAKDAFINDLTNQNNFRALRCIDRIITVADSRFLYISSGAAGLCSAWCSPFSYEHME